jgi:hypothetical protein
MKTLLPLVVFPAAMRSSFIGRGIQRRIHEAFLGRDGKVFKCNLFRLATAEFVLFVHTDRQTDSYNELADRPRVTETLLK